MDHRSALAAFRTLALRTGTTAGRAALVAARRVSTRVAEHRSTRSSTPPGGRSPDVPAGRPGPDVAEPAPVLRQRAGASPADVARAVTRNAAGLPRTNPNPRRRQPVLRNAPGAKLPARAGRGIVGV